MTRIESGRARKRDALAGFFVGAGGMMIPLKLVKKVPERPRMISHLRSGSEEIAFFVAKVGERSVLLGGFLRGRGQSERYPKLAHLWPTPTAMTDQEPILTILEKGAVAWNEWRPKKSPCMVFGQGWDIVNHE